MSFFQGLAVFFRCRPDVQSMRLSNEYGDLHECEVTSVASKVLASQASAEDSGCIDFANVDIVIPYIDESLFVESAFFESLSEYKETMRSLFELSDKMQRRFMMMDRNQAVQSWICGLGSIENLDSRSESSCKFANTILNFLELAEEYEDFRISLLEVVDGTDPTSIERLKISILLIGREYRVYKMDFSNVSMVERTLVFSEWAHDMIREFAEELHASMDHSEVTEDRVWFDLIMGINSFDRAVRVDVDLDIGLEPSVVSKDQVEALYDSLTGRLFAADGVEKILVSDEDWLKVLEDLKKEEMDQMKIDKVRMGLSGDFSRDDINSSLERRLILLTKQVLSSYTL